MQEETKAALNTSIDSDDAENPKKDKKKPRQRNKQSKVD